MGSPAYYVPETPLGSQKTPISTVGMSSTENTLSDMEGMISPERDPQQGLSEANF